MLARKKNDGGTKMRRELNSEWLNKAIEVISSGIASKLTKDDVTVYKAGAIIRIDIKMGA